MATSRQWIALQKQLVPKEKGPGSSYQKNVRRRHKEAIENALQKGYLKLLDGDLILAAQNESEDPDAAAELQDVLRISLSGCHVQAVDDITILSCAKLRICNLQACYIRDISPFYGCIHLLKLELSDNQISHLPPHDFWSSLASLRVLYLDGNAIAGKESLTRLNACQNLHVLTLQDTPLSLMKGYRHHVVNSILSLRALDEHVISDEEIIENLQLWGKFEPMTAHFKLSPYQLGRKGSSYREELCAMYRLLLAVDQVLARHSPVIFIQRWVRGWLTRRALTRTNNAKLRSLVLRKPGNSLRMQQSTSPKHQHSSKLRRVLHPSEHRRVIVPSPIPTHVCSGINTSGAREYQTGASENSEQKVKKRMYSYTVPHVSPPRVPPTSPMVSPRSPRRGNVPVAPPIETHVLGVDPSTARMHYSMHINLHKLQQNVKEAEKLEPVGVNTAFTTAFKRLDPSGSKARSKSVRQSPHKQRNTAKKSISPKTHTLPVLVEVGAGATSMRPAQEDAGKVGRVDDELDRGDGVTAGVESVVTDKIEVTGETANVLPHDCIPDSKASKLENGKKIREAEAEIKETVARAKQPPQKAEKVKKPSSMSKDELAFTRTYATMTLSALKVVEKAHEAQKKADALIKKANLVAKIKHQRLERREKLEKAQRTLRESVSTWKGAEESRLAHLREKQREKKMEGLLEKSHVQDTNVLRMYQQNEDQKFASQFNQQSTFVGTTLSREDRRLSHETRLREIKEQVQQAREVSHEHQEMVRRYMELREEKFLRESGLHKKELDAKMLQAATQHLMEVKQKVAREVARKQAARAAIALGKEELSSVRSVPPSQGMVGFSVDLPLGDTLAEKQEQGVRGSIAGKPGYRYRSPVSSHLRKISKEAHRTWQRGTQVMLDRERRAGLDSSTGTTVAQPTHFPLLLASKESPLMYEMMRPGPTYRSLTNTPALSEADESRLSSLDSQTDSLLIQQQQLAVR